jgi:hypothetical protein
VILLHLSTIDLLKVSRRLTSYLQSECSNKRVLRRDRLEEGQRGRQAEAAWTSSSGAHLDPWCALGNNGLHQKKESGSPGLASLRRDKAQGLRA